MDFYKKRQKKSEANLLMIRFRSSQRRKTMKIVRLEKNLLRQFADVRCQARFVTRRRVSVQNAFVDRFVNRRNGRCQQFLTLIFIARG